MRVQTDSFFGEHKGAGSAARLTRLARSHERYAIRDRSNTRKYRLVCDCDHVALVIDNAHRSFMTTTSAGPHLHAEISVLGRPGNSVEIARQGPNQQVGNLERLKGVDDGNGGFVTVHLVFSRRRPNSTRSARI